MEPASLYASDFSAWVPMSWPPLLPVAVRLQHDATSEKKKLSLA